jgi:hypothetical protein
MIIPLLLKNDIRDIVYRQSLFVTTLSIAAAGLPRRLSSRRLAVTPAQTGAMVGMN